MYFFYPETVNLTLEEIDFLFTERRHEHGVCGSGSGSGVIGEGNEGRSVKIRMCFFYKAQEFNLFVLFTNTTRWKETKFSTSL